MVYGLAEDIGSHVILSNLFWWSAFAMCVLAYKNKQKWAVGELPWTFLFLAFLSFGIRELGHLTKDPLLGGMRYIFGAWSAIFFTSVFMCLFQILYLRKKASAPLMYLPFAVMLLVPLLFLYLLQVGDTTSAKEAMSLVESVVWMVCSVLTIYIMNRLGTSSTGGFVRIYLLFQLAAYFAFTWKLLGILKIENYSIREIFETTFGLFAAAAVYDLSRMLKQMSSRMGGN